MKTAPIHTPSGALSPEWRRAARALVWRIREAKEYHKDYSWWPSRALVKSIHVKDVRGTCKWCRSAADTSRQMWHKECAVTYLVARGDHSIFWSVKSPNDPNDPGECAACGTTRAAWEIDHEVPLGVASRRYHLGRDRRWWRAWWVENLQWLCAECHKIKTREDRNMMRDLDKGVAQLEFTATKPDARLKITA